MPRRSGCSIARLAAVVRCIRGATEVDEDGDLVHDLDHLGEVLAGIARYDAARSEYEATHRKSRSADDREWSRWRDSGPKANDIVSGLGDLLVMSSGEYGNVLLLATLKFLARALQSQQPPFDGRRGPAADERLVPGDARLVVAFLSAPMRRIPSRITRPE
jgi:hypothetical protein